MKKLKADILLVGCVKGKCDHKSQAKDLYDSMLWDYRHKYAEQSICPWYILSAKHGLLCPDKEIKPYNQTLSKRSECREWSRRVLQELKKEVPTLQGKTIEIHAGEDYIKYGLEEGLREAGAHVHRPLKGLRIGLQYRWYKKCLASGEA